MSSNEKPNVRKLDNDYVRSNPTKNQQIEQRKRVLLRRRLAVFSVLAVIIIGLLVSGVAKQNDRLAAKQQEKLQVEAELEEMEEIQERLTLQIAKLEDDDYIAKLARKEYFLSDAGEIIFTIPKKDDADKKDKEKE